MTFRTSRDFRRLVAALVCVALVTLGSCRRPMTSDEKAARAQLQVALHEKAHERAIELARRVLRYAPQDDGAWARLVQSQLGMQDLAGTRQTFTEWQQHIAKRSAKFHELRAELATLDGDRPLAFESWTASLALNGHNVRVLRKLAHYDETEQRWSEATAAWTSLVKLQDSAAIRLRRAMSRRHLRQWDPAIDDLHHAQQAAPDDPEVKRVSAFFDRLGKLLPEIRDLDRELEQNPADAALLTDRALLLLRGGDAELACDDAAAAARLARWAVRPVLFQGGALIALDRTDEAEKLGVRKSLRVESLSSEFLETISRLDSEISAERTNGELFTARAWQLNDIGQPGLALQDAQTALRLDPKSAGACVESGYALMKLGREPEAFEVVKRATELDPNFSTAWQYRGELEMVRVDYVTAIESLTRALTINQTVTALQKREECYRRVGLFVKADQDKRALEDLTVRDGR